MESCGQLRDGMADIEPGLRLHYIDSGYGEHAAILIHGFPQTSHEWMKVVPALLDAGMRVVAADYRGAGFSSKPPTGYDKRTMACDIRTLAREHLEIDEPLVLVGHDIGAMIAVAYAMRYRDEVSHLVLLDAPLPGTSAFDRMRGDPRGWHAAFHSARDVAEMLVQGRERAYLQHMIGVRVFVPSAISPQDFDTYVHAYEAPGAMRAAFELYRTFDEDARALQEALRQGGRLEMPTLTISGAITGLATTMPEMVREIADHVENLTAPRCGHWIPEENPAFLADALLRFTMPAHASTSDRTTRRS